MKFLITRLQRELAIQIEQQLPSEVTMSDNQEMAKPAELALTQEYADLVPNRIGLDQEEFAG